MMSHPPSRAHTHTVNVQARRVLDERSARKKAEVDAQQLANRIQHLKDEVTKAAKRTKEASLRQREVSAVLIQPFQYRSPLTTARCDPLLAPFADLKAENGEREEARACFRTASCRFEEGNRGRGLFWNVDPWRWSDPAGEEGERGAASKVARLQRDAGCASRLCCPLARFATHTNTYIHTLSHPYWHPRSRRPV